ncbi:MAG: FtsX-like permease family protein [Alphaproteobacteria bacterium]|nr:MAG: FtsX-like permease family protein [Alphaproteobacteria bacterium]
MNLVTTFARRELRAGLEGFHIFVACLVLGVAAIAGVQSLSRGLSESLRHDGRYILGGDIAFRTIYKPPPAVEMNYLRTLGRISSVVQMRSMARRGDEGKATMAELKAVDSAYPLYGAMKLADAGGQPLDKDVQELLAHNGALAERGLMTRLDLKLGDTFRIGAGTFTLRGVIVKEPDRVSVESYSLAPRVMIAADALGATGLASEGAQVYYDQRIAMTSAKTPEGLKAATEAAKKTFPKESWKIRNCFNASPRIGELVDRLAFFLTLIGLTTLLVGGVGISNAVRGYLDARLSHIATLKCLGAGSRFVFRVYMTQIMALAVAAIAAGLVIGAGGAVIAGSFLTAKLSVTDRTGIYPDALLNAALFGILTAFCFSLWPVGKAVRISPAELFRDAVLAGGGKPSRPVLLAIFLSAELLALMAVVTSSDRVFALWFTGGALVVFGVFAGYSALLKKSLKRLSLPGRPLLRMAVANLHRPGNTSTSTILSLGLGLTVLSAVALIEFNFTRLIAEDLSADAPSFFFLDVLPQQKEDFEKLLRSYPGMRDLKLTPSFRGRITAVNGVEAEKALVDKNHDWVIRTDRGFTYTSALPAHSKVVEGAWWPADYKGPPLASIATDVARAFDIGAGDNLTLNILGLDITAKVANVREIDWASFTMNFAVTLAPGALDGAPATWLGTVILRPEDEEAAETRIAKDFPGITAVRVKDALETAGVIISAIAQAIRIAAGVTLLAGALVLAGGVAASRRRHVYDAVVLKVLGAGQRRILAAFLLEYGITGALTVFIAAALGAVAAWAMLEFIMNMPWKFSAKPLIAVATLCLGITLVAGFSGTWRALRQKPAAYLRAQ